MPEFWQASGYRLLAPDAHGHLAVTPAFIAAYMRRPELAIVDESCPAEIALHEALTADPLRPVSEADLARLADPDAQDNYRTVLTFRDHLLAHGTLEAAYRALFRADEIRVPSLFIDHLVHAILRHVLDGCGDPMRARAGELLFRSQKVSLMEGAILLADEDTVEMHAASGGLGDLGALLRETQTPLREVDLKVLDAEDGAAYWEHSDRYDMALDASFGRPGQEALCRVLEDWVLHMVGVAVAIQPVAQIRDDLWVWHTGLDAESSAILNDLYQGREVDEPRMRRLLSLFRLEFRDAAAMLPQVAGRPIYLGMAMDSRNVLRLKPQNLVLNLPLAPSA
jgi:hypothetical protein